MNMGQKRKTKEEILLQKRELHLQRKAKWRHSEMNCRLHYSIKYYRKYAPEDLEQHWIENIERLKRRIVEYEKNTVNEKENSK